MMRRVVVGDRWLAEGGRRREERQGCDQRPAKALRGAGRDATPLARRAANRH